MLELTDSLKTLLQQTANCLKGHERPRFMAQTVEELERGGSKRATYLMDVATNNQKTFVTI